MVSSVFCTICMVSICGRSSSSVMRRTKSFLVMVPLYQDAVACSPTLAQRLRQPLNALRRIQNPHQPNHLDRIEHHTDLARGRNCVGLGDRDNPRLAGHQAMSAMISPQTNVKVVAHMLTMAIDDLTMDDDLLKALAAGNWGKSGPMMA